MTRVVIDGRYLVGRPSGIGAYVKAIIDRAPTFTPDWQYELWLKRGAPSAKIEAPNVTERFVDAPPNSLPTVLWPGRLADLSSVDVFHATFNILGRGIPSAVVTTIHDIMWLMHPTLCEGISPAMPFLTAFYAAGILQAVHRSDRIVAISQATADTLAQRFPKQKHKVRVIHHGIEPRFRPTTGHAEQAAVEAAAKALVGDDSRYFLVIGQNTPSKNHAAVLEAFAAANLPQNVRLVLLQRLYQRGRFGTLRDPELLRLARRLGIEHRVKFLERVSDDDVVRLYQGALALIQFSRFEGFGMPALEACASGTPVIASDIAPLVEVLGGAAVHARLDGPELMQAMQRLASDPSLREDLRGRGLERSRDFSWDKCAQLHLEVYREAAALRR